MNRRHTAAIAILSGFLLGAADAYANSVVVPYFGSFNESSVAASGGLPAGDYDTIGGPSDVGLFNLVAGANTFTGSVFTPPDSSDAFVIGIGPNQKLVGASMAFGTNLTEFNPLFAAPGPHWTLEESSPTPTIFDLALGFKGQDATQNLTAPSFLRELGIYSVLIGNGTFATNNSGPVFYTMTFNVEETVSQTPLPAALPLFASGGALLGFLGWRRKRKAIATA